MEQEISNQCAHEIRLNLLLILRRQPKLTQITTTTENIKKYIFFKTIKIRHKKNVFLFFISHIHRCMLD